MTAEEARQRLTEWRNILLEKMKGITAGPWYRNAHSGQGWSVSSAEKYNLAFLEDDAPEIEARRNARFIAFSRQVVVALLAAIEAVLENVGPRDKYWFPTDGVTEVPEARGEDLVMIVFAESMAPFFEEDKPSP